MANLPWADSSVFEYATPCCACPVECPLGIPGSPFASLEEAEAGMDNVLSCRCYFYPNAAATLPTSRSFSYDSDSFSASYSYEAATESGADAAVLLNAYLPSGTVSFSVSGSVTCESGMTLSSGGSITLFGPDGELTSTSSTGEFEISEAGCYLISILYGGICDCPPPPDECLPGITVALATTVTMTGMILGIAEASYGGGTLYCE